MPQQSSFPDFGSPAPKEKLFLAVMPDLTTAQHVAQLTQQLRETHNLTGDAVIAEKLHVTIHFIGYFSELPTALIKSISHEAALVKASPFTARFDHAGSFANQDKRQPLVLRGGDGVAGFIGLNQALARTVRAGSAKLSSAKSFTPHMTVFYGSHLANVAIEPIEWLVTEFVLLRSHTLMGKPYDVVGRWALQSN
jgi:2'-5' RNA ligase